MIRVFAVLALAVPALVTSTSGPVEWAQQLLAEDPVPIPEHTLIDFETCDGFVPTEAELSGMRETVRGKADHPLRDRLNRADRYRRHGPDIGRWVYAQQADAWVLARDQSGSLVGVIGSNDDSRWMYTIAALLIDTHTSRLPPHREFATTPLNTVRFFWALATNPLRAMVPDPSEVVGVTAVSSAEADVTVRSGARFRVAFGRDGQGAPVVKSITPMAASGGIKHDAIIFEFAERGFIAHLDRPIALRTDWFSEGLEVHRMVRVVETQTVSPSELSRWTATPSSAPAALSLLQGRNAPGGDSPPLVVDLRNERDRRRFQAGLAGLPREDPTYMPASGGWLALSRVVGWASGAALVCALAYWLLRFRWNRLVSDRRSK